MRNLKFKAELEYNHIMLFFNKLKIKHVFNENYIDERFITYNNIIDIIIDEENYTLLNQIKLKLFANMDINLIFLNLINEYPSLFNEFRNSIEFYFDTDLMKSYK